MIINEIKTYIVKKSMLGVTKQIAIMRKLTILSRKIFWYVFPAFSFHHTVIIYYPTHNLHIIIFVIYSSYPYVLSLRTF